MPAKNINLAFEGYWRDINSGSVPAESGVYLVYRGTHNPDKTVTLHQLIYVGESDDVRKRIQAHEKRPTWKSYLKAGQELCFAFAPIAKPDRQRAEAALIFNHKPPVNDEYKTSFPFDETTVRSTGCCKFIEAVFTVRRTVPIGQR
ncbi:MAG: GIY-YIG nuclease family protein [Dehalococcoidia bacterium]